MSIPIWLGIIFVFVSVGLMSCGWDWHPEEDKKERFDQFYDQMEKEAEETRAARRAARQADREARPPRSSRWKRVNWKAGPR